MIWDYIVYALAAIGGLTVLSAVLFFVLICAESKRQFEEENSRTTYRCAYTGELCLYTDAKKNCTGCPIYEEKAGATQ